METTGKLTQVSQNWNSKNINLTFTVENVSGEEINSIYECDKLTITAKKYREKRSLDANAYYWVLVGKLAKKLRCSANFLHNYYLRQCPVYEIIDGQMVYLYLPNTEEAEKKIDESMTYHLQPTSELTADADYREYKMLRGSHTYDTSQMSALIDLVVQDAKAQGIETMTPEELERMKATWQPKSQH